MSTLSLEQQIGSLLMIGFAGNKLSAKHHVVRDIAKYNLGGVILFDRLLALGHEKNNITSPQQIIELTSFLQGLRNQPLLIAVDQEGGMVSRFKEKHGFPITSTPEQLGKDSKKSAEAARQTASMLKKAGVNWNLAPTTDLNVFPENPIIGRYERSFSDKAEIVYEHNSIWIEEQRKCGILSCLKHFPGHGSSKADSHKGFVDITDTWQKKELIPYQNLIANHTIDAIMIGHLFHRDLDDTLPASLSPKVINTLLRKELGYDGLVVTDDMQMGAITKHYGIEKACSMALAAGVDLLILGNNIHYDSEIVPKIIHHCVQSIKDETLSIKRVQEAVSRVQKLQSKTIRSE